jgi:hypothetical protein
MDFSAFKETLQNSTPPARISVYLKALWYDANGDWQQSHDLIQDLPDKTAARIHAYLHRKEGDQGNALHWYHRAGMKGVSIPLEKEWEEIVRDVL